MTTLDLSRRTFLRGSALAGGAAMTLGAVFVTTPALASSKFSQSMAKYQGSPKGAQRCQGCSQFQASNACKVVDGKISPDGWCLLYAPKAG